ncbi:MAG: ABC transporter ATP-binding protein [Bacilli bacterium]|nr:ABC transporter ATP-binding protein [Acholeplasmataceae bacterium]
MIKISHLYKKYHGSKVYAVKDLSLELKSGEIFGFLGPNGAGKSTTIKCLVGLLPYEQGEITINGINLKDDPMGAKLEMGYVPDNHAVFERLTGREYVNHIANLYNVSLEDREERAEKFVKMFNLQEAYDHQINSYSHGMKQKIAVIATLIHNPKVWILDEPLTGLDPQSAFQLKQAMRDHVKEGNIVFFSSHILDVVQNLCNRVGIIKKGVIQGFYDLEEIKKSNQSLEEIFMKVIAEVDEKDKVLHE